MFKRVSVRQQVIFYLFPLKLPRSGINATVFDEVKLSHNGNAIMPHQSKLEEQRKQREAERAERDAARALRDAQRAKLRLALKAKKIEYKKREQARLDGNTESVSEPPAQSKDDELNLSKKKQSRIKQRNKLFESAAEEFQFHIEPKMLESSNDDDEQKENENGSTNDDGTGLVAELSFFGNYGEPNLCVPLSPFLQNLSSSVKGADDGTLQFMCRLVMDIGTKQWEIQPLSEESAMIHKLSSDGHSVEEVNQEMDSLDLLSDDKEKENEAQ